MKLFAQLRWYYITRGIGALAALYELGFDHTPERGTIILAAFGLMGFDWVAKREEPRINERKASKRRTTEELQEIKDALKRRENRS